MTDISKPVQPFRRSLDSVNQTRRQKLFGALGTLEMNESGIWHPANVALPAPLVPPVAAPLIVPQSTQALSIPPQGSMSIKERIEWARQRMTTGPSHKTKELPARIRALGAPGSRGCGCT